MNTYLIYFNDILRDIISAQSLLDARKQAMKLKAIHNYTGKLFIHSLI